ncbi:MAG: MaoC family dehydratase [Deltaproteobacteria bacterium]|nr:MaoC family dehydratase [Deltaproteobacteria bacterium]
MSQPLLRNPQEGMELFGVVKHLSQEKINRFASISGGTGRIHVDPEFAKKTRFQSTLAHGILLIAYLSEMMKNNFGKPWFNSGDMEIRFVGPAKPGDTLVTKGKIHKTGVIQNQTQISCLVWVENQCGEKVAEGNTFLTLES